MKKIFLILIFILIPFLLFSQVDIAKREIKVDTLKARVDSLWMFGPVIFDSPIHFPDGSIQNTAYPDTAAEWVARTIYVSMPTDLQTPGSDVTGDGSIALPYATINKALTNFKNIINAPITIQLDSGNFTIYDDDIRLLNDKLFTEKINGYPFTISGTTIDILTGITMTVDPSNSFKWNVSGASWTTDVYEGMFVKVSSSYYPIESNTSNQLTSTNTSAGTSIVKNITSINFNTTNLGSLNIKSSAPSGNNIVFQNISFMTSNNIMFQTSNQSTNSTSFKFISCNLIGNRGIISCASRNHYFWFSNSFLKVNYNSTTNTILTIAQGTYCVLQNTIIKNNYQSGIGLLTSIGSTSAILNCIFSNLTAFSTGFEDGGYFHNKSSKNFFKNITSIFQSSTVFNIIYVYAVSNTLYYENCTNLFDIQNIGNQIFWYQPYSLTGITNIFSSTSVIKNKFYLPDKNIIINIAGTYPEYQQDQSATLTNNSTDSISIADLTYNRSIELKANIVRGTDYQTKTIKVLNTGSAYTMVQLGDSIQTGDLGVRFDGVYKSGTSNILKLKWHTTSTGTNATMTYNAYRQNY